MALDQWLGAGKVDLRGSELTILEEDRRYQIAEAVHILKEVGGSPDTPRLVGRVKLKDVLEKNGAEVFDTSIILGENAYDVVPGWMGVPIGSFEEHRAARPGSGEFDDHEPKTDEDLLARFVLGSLK